MDFEGKNRIFMIKNEFLMRKKSVFLQLRNLYYFKKMKKEAERNLLKPNQINQFLGL